VFNVDRTMNERTTRRTTCRRVVRSFLDDNERSNLTPPVGSRDRRVHSLFTERNKICSQTNATNNEKASRTRPLSREEKNKARSSRCINVTRHEHSIRRQLDQLLSIVRTDRVCSVIVFSLTIDTEWANKRQKQTNKRRN
jgi:hypothetical protein